MLPPRDIVRAHAEYDVLRPMLWLVGCLALVPQLPLLADGLAPMVESWRAAAP